MSSVSQQIQIPSQPSNSSSASQPPLSYPSTAKKAVSSPAIATGSSSTPSPAVAVGGSVPVQHHGKSASISPVNGRVSIPPAVPAVSAPAIAHSSAAMNGGSADHGRKSSVTISANAPNSYVTNGGPVGGSKSGIQFGSITDSPAASHSTPQMPQPATAPIPIPSNPRVVSPAQSPSPIPQPSASGGRPPSGLAQGNGMTFGSLGGDGDRHMRQATSTQGPVPGNQSTTHLRRDSAHSTQSDVSAQGLNAGRGGFPPQGGRGRGSFNPQYQQQMGYPPASQPYRNSPNPGRSMPAPFQTQGRPMNQFPNSPHQAGRSPALANSVPGTPNMNQSMPMQNPQQYPYNNNMPYLPPPQVLHPSSTNNASDTSRPNFRGKYKRWSARNEQSSNCHRLLSRDQREPSHQGYPPFEQLPSERGEYGRNYMEHVAKPMEYSARGRFTHHKPVYAPLAGPLECHVSPNDQQSLFTHLHIPPPPPLHASFTSLPPPSSLLNAPQIDVSKMDLSPSSQDFERYLTTRQNYGYPPQYDPRAMPLQAPYMFPQMQFMNGPPQSPQPGYQQANAYVPGQYANQAQAQTQSMSRNSSQMSEQRSASSMGQPQTPSIPPIITNTHVPQPKVNPPQASAFSRPARKSAAILIKRPDGEALDVEAFKAPASPAHSNRARTPPVIASTPTPPPNSATSQHGRSDSAAATKTSEQIKLEMIEKVKKAAEGGDKAAAEAQAKADEAKAAETKKQKEEAAQEQARVAEEAKAKAEAEAKEAADKKAKEEEEELERQIQEVEAAEAERERKEAEMLAKRAAEKEAAEKANFEKKKAEGEENDRKLKEAEREMERLEDERERKRAEADSKVEASEKSEDDSDSKKESNNLKPETKDAADESNTASGPNTLASKLSNLNLGTDSGASTPASDDSMGPPPKVQPTEKRGKPAALNLAPLNKLIEAPQPSAALQSLKSARFLTVLNSSIYPPNIHSPNPALNNAVITKGKSFKYDKEFLLQFQKVFVEKPSLEFESQIKVLIGDGDAGASSRAGSTRAPGGGGMGPRQGSRAGGNQPGGFTMGSFGASGGKTLPPGTTSAERYAMASGTLPRPNIIPMASFNRPGGAGFPGGNPMARTPSSSTMNSMPHSPRQQSRSQRGNSKRENFQGGNAKQEAQAAKTMPLTAGMDLKPIQITAGGWKPTSIAQTQSATGAAGPAPGASSGTGHMEPDMVQRKVKAALNKMTPEKFDKIADQILAIAAQSKDEADGRTLRQVIALTFEKATDEAHWASMYAKFCKRMLETMSPDIKDESIRDKNNNVVSGGNLFRKYLLNRCQEEFERGWKMALPDKPEGERGEEKTEEAVMLSDEYYIAAAAKRRGLGLVQFIGELYKLSMLTERIMHECVHKLVDYTGIPDEAEIESLTKLLKTIGSNLDSTEKGKPMMDIYFGRIQSMIDTPELPSRLRFMLMDILDLRRKGWASKEDNKGPKTLEEVRAEAEAAAAQKAAENARGPRGGGGSGGRMQMGRGDSRNFSNQYGNQPPVDYAKNTVGMDDLRRLTNKGGASRQASQQMSFGPTSMFSSRSNSGRKMGPGGSLSRPGEDSGASSRTGTPPQKEKESTTSANSFSLLAALGSSDTNPASPPSTSVSPALSKVDPVASEKATDKKSE